MEIGIAGWALNRSILREKSITQLDFIRLAREQYKVDTIELVSTFFESQSAKYLNQLREEIAKHRLRVANIAVDTGTLASADKAARRTDIEAIAQWFHVARAVGSEAIRVNTGQADDAEALDRVIDGYRELAEHAAQSKVKLLIENHGGVSSDPAALRTILDGVKTDWFGACPDVNNFAGDTWEEGMKIMAPRAVVVHIKNHNYDMGGMQTFTDRTGAQRRFDLKKSLQILKESGYKGPLNFENNMIEEDERVGLTKGIEYTTKLAKAVWA